MLLYFLGFPTCPTQNGSAFEISGGIYRLDTHEERCSVAPEAMIPHIPWILCISSGSLI